MAEAHHAAVAFAESAIAALLSAPHISLPHPPTGIRTGPGPIDLFSTKFNNTFTREAMGVVDGKQVDREELKESLLALQSHYNPDTVKFQSQEAAPYGQGIPGEAKVDFTWTTKDAVEHEVSSKAVVVTQGGTDKLSSLVLKGKEALFVNANSSA